MLPPTSRKFFYDSICLNFAGNSSAQHARRHIDSVAEEAVTRRRQTHDARCTGSTVKADLGHELLLRLVRQAKVRDEDTHLEGDVRDVLHVLVAVFLRNPRDDHV